MAVSLVAQNIGTRDEKHSGACEFLIDAQSDLTSGNEQIDDAPAGSVAYIADSGKVYMKKNSGSWVEFGGA